MWCCWLLWPRPFLVNGFYIAPDWHFVFSILCHFISGPWMVCVRTRIWINAVIISSYTRTSTHTRLDPHRIVFSLHSLKFSHHHRNIHYTVSGVSPPYAHMKREYVVGTHTPMETNVWTCLMRLLLLCYCLLLLPPDCWLIR